MRIALRAPSAHNARAAVAAMLVDLPRETLEVAVLLTSELVANAIEHAGGAHQLIVECSASVIIVEVSDDDPALPAVRSVGPDEPRGRGLFLVDRMSSRWCTRSTAQGKVVAFELDL
ncbi:MAG: ATP-binding region ATPase domain protein [Acidimicrobiaceae bacterium]|nr:ATP-binding region ATPase domain protein [Acidimicrobiaceae bacterium]